MKHQVKAAIKAKPEPNAQYNIKNIQLTGVQWDKSSVDLLINAVNGYRDAIKGIDKVVSLLDSSNVNIDSLLHVGGTMPETKEK